MYTYLAKLFFNFQKHASVSTLTPKEGIFNVLFYENKR